MIRCHWRSHGLCVVNEDWRWRMVTAQEGDFPGVPLNPAGRNVPGSGPATTVTEYFDRFASPDGPNGSL